MSAIAESNGEETEEAPSIAECPKIVENGLPEVDEQKHLGQIEVRTLPQDYSSNRGPSSR